MEILLRKASSIAAACGETAAGLARVVNSQLLIELSVHSVPASPEEASAYIERTLTTASKRVMDTLEDIVQLYQAQSTIRMLIGQANALHGLDDISRLLTERAVFLKPVERQLSQVVLQTERQHVDDRDVADIAKRIQGIRRQMETNTTGIVHSDLAVPALSQNDVNELKERIAWTRRRQLDVNDEVARKNLNQYITVPEMVVNVLKKHRLID